MRRNAINKFKQATYSAFKKTLESDLNNNQVFTLFKEIITITNLKRFLSNKFDIIYSKATNQFAFLYKSEGSVYVKKNKLTLKKLKIEPADLVYDIEDLLVCKIKTLEDETLLRYYDVKLEGYDKTYSIRSDLIDDEERKARLRIFTDQLPISDLHPFINEPQPVESKIYQVNTTESTDINSDSELTSTPCDNNSISSLLIYNAFNSTC